MIYTPSRRGRLYGYYQRNHRNLFAVRFIRKLEVMPPSVDLRSQCPPVVDQGNLGACTANAIAGAYQFERIKAGLPPLTPSRLFIYWNERDTEDDTDEDAGAFGGDGIDSLQTIGVCDESLWPYDVTQFAVQPPPSAFAAAAANKVLQRQVLNTLDDVRGALAEGHMVPFGITVYESFESDEAEATGNIPDPQPGEGVLGGHEMDAVGYENSTGRIIVRNSWGLNWGQSGYGTLSYDYFKRAGSDYEVITKI